MEGQITVAQNRSRPLFWEALAPAPIETEPRWPPFWRDAVLLGSLILIATGVRVWQIAKAEVASRDSIGFIRMAWQMDHRPVSAWGEVFRQSEQHPGYPVAIVVVKTLFGHALPQPESVAWQIAAQSASAVFGVFLVFPTYFFGRALFDRRVAFGSCLLVQCLPASSRVLGDGLSEAMFLFLAVAAWLASLHAFRKQSAWRFMLCGISGGCAYLVRPEGALIVAMTLLALLGMQVFPSLRRPRFEVWRCAGGLLIGAGLMGGPFVWITGKLTTKPTPNRVLDWQAPAGPDFPHENAARTPSAMDPPVVIASIFASWSDNQASSRLAWGAKALGFEILKGSFFVLWLPALVGVWWFRDRFREPGVWPPVLVCSVILLLLWRVASLMGYVSDRHLLLLSVFSTYWAVAALFELPRRVRTLARATWLPVALILAVAATGLAKSLEPLHADRAGFKAAGLWIAERVTDADVVLDPYCWSHYYAGQVFREGTPQEFPKGTKRTRYVVLEKSSNLHIRLLPYVDEAREWTKVAQLVHSEPAPRGKDKSAEVLVYAVPIPFPPAP